MKSILMRSSLFRFVIAVLILISLCFTLITTNKVKVLNSDISNKQTEASWFVYQLVKEYANLTTQIRLTPVIPKDISLAYELTWSRFDLLLNSHESSSFMKDKGTRTFFEREFTEFRKLEDAINLFEEGKLEKNLIVKKILIRYSRLVEFTNEKLRLSNPQLTRNQIEISSLISHHNLSIALAILLTILLLSIIITDNVNTEKYRTKDTLTNTYSRVSFFESLDNRKLETEKTFCLIVIKIVNLKDINKRFGVNYGDMILVKIANQIQSIIERANSYEDIPVFRFTEKTFLIMLGTTTREKNDLCADSFNEKIILADTDFIPEVSIISLEDVSRDKIVESLSSLDIR